MLTLGNPLRAYLHPLPERQPNPGGVIGTVIVLGLVGVGGYAIYKHFSGDKPAAGSDMPGQAIAVWKIVIYDRYGGTATQEGPFTGYATKSDGVQINTGPVATYGGAETAIIAMVKQRGGDWQPA